MGLERELKFSPEAIFKKTKSLWIITRNCLAILSSSSHFQADPSGDFSRGLGSVVQLRVQGVSVG